MRFRPACLALAMLGCVFATAATRAGDDEKPLPPLTAAVALKLGAEGLTRYTNESESGQDQAARLYAIARRLKTENALAQKEIEQIPVLDNFREALSKVRVGSWELTYLVNGGGSMYTHSAARECATIEDFLAGFAKDMPLAEGKGSAKANAKIDAAIAFLKALKTYDAGEPDADKEAAARLDTERARVIGQWENLKSDIPEIPAAQADKIAAFADDSLSWLKPE